MNSKHVPYPRIGTYRLIEAYATQGRSGVVWKAEDKTGAKVVIKAPDFNELPAVLAKQRKEIATEIEVLERLQEFSPPVISLLYKDMVQHAGEYYPYAVLEQLDESQNLYHIILNDYQRYSVLPVLELLDIFHWMLTVLDHAHKVGIVYNDVDMKHIFWSRVLEASVFRDEARRIRVIDWANSFFSTDLADQQKDIHQAGELLHDIFSVVHTKPLEATQKYTSDIRQLLEDIQGGVFTSIADLISAVDRFRYDVQRVFHLLLGDIDKQIRQAIDADFDQVNGLIEKAQNLYREYHYCDQIFWQTWDSWHELIIERVVLQIKQLIGLGQYAIIDELINYLQHQINQLADTYDGTSRDSLIRLSDFMRLSVRIIRRIQDTTNSAQKETQVSAISDTWSNLLPPTNRLEFSRLIHNILIHANGLIFEDWRDLCHAAYLFAYIYDVPEQDWPLDIRLIRYLFKGDPSGEILDENAQRCVIDYHNRMLSSDSFLFALEESIQGQNFDHHITSLLNYVREELRQELEQLPLTSKAFADVDYWHRDLITKSQNQLRHLAAQYRHLRRVHFFSERSNKWYEVQSLEHFDAWIVSYASFLQNWNTCGKDTGILDQWLRQAKKSFEGLIDALHMGHVGQAKTHYSELTLSLDILTDTGHDWLDSKLPKKILDVKGPEQTIELWQSQLAPSRNPIRDVCINVLNITLRIDEYRSFELERECRRKLERSYEEINKLIETHSENQQLGNLVKILRSIIGGVLDPASTSFGPDRQIWDQVPQSSFRESAQKYLHTRELGNQLAQVQTLEQATELFSRLSPERVEPNSQIGDSHHSIIATLKPITDVKTRWENGDFAYHKELSRLRTKLETDPWFQKSAILELATIMHHNFQHAQEIIEEIKEMRTQLLSWLTNRHSQQLSITSSEYQVPQSTIVDDIIDKYDKIIQIGNQFYNESNSIHEWRNYLRSYVDLVSTPNMIQMPQAKENDPLIGVYTTFNKLLPKQRPSRYKRLSIIAAFLAGISAVLLILFLIIYFNRESIQELISIDSALIANETATDLSSFTITPTSMIFASATVLPTPTPIDPDNIQGEILRDTQLFAAVNSDSADSVIVAQGDMLTIRGISPDGILYLAEYQGQQYWVSRDNVEIPEEAQAIIPILPSTQTPSPTNTSTSTYTPTPTATSTPTITPFPIIDFNDEREIQLILGSLDSAGNSLSPFTQPLFDYYFNIGNVIISGGRYRSALEEPTQSQIHPPSEARLRNPIFDRSYVPIPVHLPTLDVALELNGEVPDFRIEATLWQGEAAVENGYYGINAIITSIDRGITEVNVIWLLAIIRQSSPIAVGDFVVYVTDPTAPIPQDLRDELALQYPAFEGDAFSPYLITYLPPIADNILDTIYTLPQEFHDRNVSQVDIGFSRTQDGNIAIIIDQFQVGILDYPYDNIEQFTIVADNRIGVQFNTVSIRTR